jgi:hypothetical protein
LFDDRADTAARHARAVIARCDAALARRLAGITSPATVADAIATQVAAWARRQP